MTKGNIETQNRGTVKQGHASAVYPLKHTKHLADLDTWSHMFVMRFFGRLTVYNFPAPPGSILDLGCGTGTWVIDAAREFNNAFIVGLDMEDRQPPLEKAGFSDVATRVKWVHSNFLDPLPFAANSFDFVRARYIGLGIPEHKWQDLLEEIFRILKPGGQLEIMEEDQRFPCGPYTNSPTYSLPPSSSVSKFATITKDTNPTYMQTKDTDSSSQNSKQPPEFDIDPRDHRRLAESWRHMLQSRFISPQSVSILSFYLSQFFDRVDHTAQLHMRLPPNSHLALKDGQDASSAESFKSGRDSPIGRNPHPNPPPFVKDWDLDSVQPTSRKPLPPTILALNLARRVATVAGCKEAIWSAYETLYSEAPSVHRLSSPNEVTVRAEFEAHWSNWKDDMADRIDMRNMTSSALSWPLPPLLDTPSSTIWRSRCGTIYADDPGENDPDLNPDETNVFRTFRGFIAWKAPAC